MPVHLEMNMATIKRLNPVLYVYRIWIGPSTFTIAPSGSKRSRAKAA